jgi:hypothetical protein
MTAARDLRQTPARFVQRLAATARRRDAASPSLARSSREVTLRVTRGRHQGAEAELVGGRITIGSSLDGDIVLTDRGIAAQHLTVDMVGKPGARSLTISALETGVLIGGDELAPGTPRSFKMPVTIDIADAVLQFVDPVPAERASLSVVTALPLAVAAGIGAGALGTWAFSPQGPPASYTPSRTYVGAPSTAAPSPLPTGTIALTDAAKAMQLQITAAGFEKQIKVTQRDNVLMAEGTLPVDAFPKWRAIKIAVRDNTSERLLIADMVKPLDTSEGPRAMIAAVTGGKIPSVMGTNGKRAGIGEILADGWVVRQITADAVQLERGGSRVTVKLTP